MEGNIKIYASIFLLLFTIIHVLVPGGQSFGLHGQLTTYLIDDYNNSIPFKLNVIDTQLNPGVANYPNTVRFYLYTKERSKDSIRLYIGDSDSLKLGKFDPSKPTVIITHGWQNDHESPACVYVRDAYLRKYDYNVITVDWGDLAKDGIYVVAARVILVAKYVSKMLDFLVSQGMKPETTTMAGHSFGGHLAGLASYYAKQKMHFVIAMDPAGPAFRDKHTGTRLSPEDATYVQAIHTTSVFGLTVPVAHSDFFVNSGIDQPDCWFPVVCGHQRSYHYFSESLSSDGFIARKCDSYSKYLLGLCNSNQSVRMGGAIPDYNATGVYYLDTHPKPPYAKF